MGVRRGNNWKLGANLWTAEGLRIPDALFAFFSFQSPLTWPYFSFFLYTVFCVLVHDDCNGALLVNQDYSIRLPCQEQPPAPIFFYTHDPRDLQVRAMSCPGASPVCPKQKTIIPTLPNSPGLPLPQEILRGYSSRSPALATVMRYYTQRKR